MPSSIKDRGIILAIASVTYVLYGIAWPLTIGRDFGNYIFYFADIWQTPSLFPFLMLYRMPLPAFILVPPLGLGALWPEIILGIVYVLTIYFVFSSTATINRSLAWITSLALLAYPPLGALMHSAGAEALFAGIWVISCAYCVRANTKPSITYSVTLAGLALLLTFIKPIGQLSVLFLLLFWIRKQAWQKATLSSLIFLGLFGGVLLGWSGYNYLRWQDFTIARGGIAQVPLYRAFVIDQIVHPTNGPASAQLGSVVTRLLLSQEPYASRGITVDDFFRSGEPRMFYDLLTLSDLVWGWDSDYSILRKAGFEAVIKHPQAYLRGVMRSIGASLLLPYHHTPPQPTSIASPEPLNSAIPASHHWWLATSPDQRSRTVWHDNTHSELQFQDPTLQEKLRTYQALSQQLQERLPARHGNEKLSGLFNAWSTVYPPMGFWLLLTLVAFFIRPRSVEPHLLTLTIIALVILMITFSGVQYTPHLRIPFDALFIMTGMIAIYRLWSIKPSPLPLA